MFIGNIGTNAANGINDIILNTSFRFWNIFFIWVNLTAYNIVLLQVGQMCQIQQMNYY